MMNLETQIKMTFSSRQINFVRVIFFFFYRYSCVHPASHASTSRPENYNRDATNDNGA